MNQPTHVGAHGQTNQSGQATHDALAPNPMAAPDLSLDPIGLVDEPQAALDTAKKIKAFGIAGTAKIHDWKRKSTANGTGAVRCRSFHGRLSDQGLGFMDDQINEWLDSHPDVEVKFVTSTVGQYEGKIREPALVLNLWY